VSLNPETSADFSCYPPAASYQQVVDSILFLIAAPRKNNSPDNRGKLIAARINCKQSLFISKVTGLFVFADIGHKTMLASI